MQRGRLARHQRQPDPGLFREAGPKKPALHPGPQTSPGLLPHPMAGQPGAFPGHGRGNPALLLPGPSGRRFRGKNSLTARWKKVCPLPNKKRPGKPKPPGARKEIPYALGQVRVKVLPSPSVLSSWTSAPMQAAPCFTMESPRPVPPISLEWLLSTR